VRRLTADIIALITGGILWLNAHVVSVAMVTLPGGTRLKA
jgi:hypothetical protein